MSVVCASERTRAKAVIIVPYRATKLMDSTFRFHRLSRLCGL